MRIAKRKKPLQFPANITIKDTGREGFPTIKNFQTQKEAEAFIESHERPFDLICEFDKNFVKRTLEVCKNE